MATISEPLFRFLDTVGDGTGIKNAAVDGATQQVFKVVPGVGEFLEISRMMVSISDNGPLSADDYGKLPELANGIGVEIRQVSDDAVVLDLLDGVPIRANADWSRMCYDMSYESFGSGSDFIKARWTFSQSGIMLRVPNDQYFCVTVNDDLTGLNEQHFMVQGFKRVDPVEE